MWKRLTDGQNWGLSTISKGQDWDLILKKASMKDSQRPKNAVQPAYCLDTIDLSFNYGDARAGTSSQRLWALVILVFHEASTASGSTVWQWEVAVISRCLLFYYYIQIELVDNLDSDDSFHTQSVRCQVSKQQNLSFLETDVLSCHVSEVGYN